MEKVYRDKDNNVVHIGDLCPDANKQLIDECTCKEEKIIEIDGGKYAASDYKRLRLMAYPPIPEQIDYIYHHGVEALRENVIKPIKDKYPKPE